MKFRYLLGLLFISCAFCQDQQDPFHVSDDFEKRVEFWEKVFSKYTTRQIVIHDSEKPERIYCMLDLDDLTDQGFVTETAKRELIRKTKVDICAILEKFSSGNFSKDTLSPEEIRIRSLFDDNADTKTFRQAMECIHAQKGAMESFREGLIRSGRYVTAMKIIFKEAGLPEDLVYLAHVESSFHPKARSPVGAVGVWQIMQSTGKKFLTINTFMDERRDPIMSTSGATQLLKLNYEKTGDWALAITAYNHGLNGVRRAISYTGKRDLETIINTYHSPLWGYASKNFYAEFLAARRISQNPDLYFPEIELEPPLEFKQISLPFSFSMNEVAEMFQVSSDVIAEMNPALNQAIRKQGQKIPKGYMLRIPVNADAMGATLISTGIGASIQAF